MFSSAWKRLAIFVLVGLPSACLAANPSFQKGVVLNGEITKVVDGDTVDIRTVDGVVRVRLAQIDAPESAQPYGTEATLALSRLVLNKAARVNVLDTDRYGRAVGDLFVAGVNIGFELVRQGHAWAYTDYVKTLEVIDLEDEARRHERGLWQLAEQDRDAPWNWRKRGRRSETAAKQPQLAPGCELSPKCSEMTRCAEAMFQFRTCGRRPLDGDGDGVPCERLCGNSIQR